MWLGDDAVFLTLNWDIEMVSALNIFKERLGVVHVNDLSSTYDQNYATIGMVHKSWFSLFNYLFTPLMRDNGIDFWISNVAKSNNRLVYLDKVKVEHRQYRQGKSEIDQTYINRLMEHKTYNPIYLYHELANERRRDQIILSLATNSSKIPFDKNYVVGLLIYKFSKILKKSKVSHSKIIYINSIKNFQYFRIVTSKIGIPFFKYTWD